MKTALCQLEIEYENREKNLQKAEKYIREASENGADIVFFPEMTLSGFSMNINKTGENNSQTISDMKVLSEKYKIAVGFGWTEIKSEKGRNHYSVVSPDGTVLADYVKIHPFSYGDEEKYFEAGSELVSFTYCEKRISLFVCYDLRFPEIFQAASEESEVIVIAANWPEKRSYHWRTLLAARAIENQSWILGVNCCGMQESQYYSGNTSAIMPDGALASEISDREGIVYAQIDKEAFECRKAFPVKKDRKKELYRSFIS